MEQLEQSSNSNHNDNNDDPHLHLDKSSSKNLLRMSSAHRSRPPAARVAYRRRGDESILNSLVNASVNPLRRRV